MKKLLRLDWDLIAGILAAITALVLHMLHIVQQEVVLAVMLVLLTLLLVRDLRSEHKSEKLLEIGERVQTGQQYILGTQATGRASHWPTAIAISQRGVLAPSTR